jgi:hypothetical protein
MHESDDNYYDDNAHSDIFKWSDIYIILRNMANEMSLPY